MKYIILWEGYNLTDFDIVDGTLEEAIAKAKDGYDDYGRKKATIVPYNPIYRVRDTQVETTDKNEMGA